MKYRFAAFELDLATGELRKNGLKIKLQDQPLTVLGLLLERRGDLVTREEIRNRLWPADTFVDFDRSLNTAINRLRDALGDQAENPRYVETLPRRGYRFIFPAEVIGVAAGNAAAGAAATPAASEGPAVSATGVASGTVAAAAPPQPATSGFRTRLWIWRGSSALVIAGAIFLYFSGWRVHRAPATSQRTIVAVLPFANLSGDPAQDYFSDGQTEELITRLSRVSPARIGVIGHTSMAAYKRDGKDLKTIGQEMGAQYVVEGSVTRSGDRVRINARLIPAQEQTPVWSNSYDRDLRDILQIQAEVATEIAQQVVTELGPRKNAPAATPVDREAYDAMLRGRYFMNRRTDEDLKKGVTYLQQATAKDPNSALAHAWLADAYNLMGFYSVLPPNDAYARAKQEASRALELNPNLAEAHAALADLTYIHDWNWTAAESEFQKALQLDPNYASAHQWYGMFLALEGKNAEAIAEIQKALAIEPLSLVINADLGLCYYYGRQNERALNQYQKTLDLDRTFSLTHNWMGMALVAVKRYDDAIQHFERAVEYSGGSQGSYALLAYAHGIAGHKKDAAATIQTLIKMSHERYVSPSYISIAYVGSGDHNAVFTWADKAVEDHAALLVRLKVEPYVDPVRGDPRFPKLLARIGLTP